MASLTIVVWNIAGGLSKGVSSSAIGSLRHDLGADIALLQEASVHAGDEQWHGQPFEVDSRNSSHWGSYVVSLRSDLVLQPVPTVPVGEHHGPTSLEASQPGSVATAGIDFNGTRVWVASTYGALDDGPVRQSVGSMHRVLSDLLPLAHDGVPLLMAGDLNVTTQPYRSGDPGGWWHRQDQTVFDRIAAMGFVDLVDQHLGDDRHLEGCPCERMRCRHVRTTRHRHDEDSTPYQNDWAFATASFASLVKSCDVLDDERYWACSDHAPIRLVL